LVTEQESHGRERTRSSPRDNRIRWPWADVVPEEVVTGRYDTGFAVGLLAKDVTIAAGIAEGSGVAAPLCQLVRRRWAEAAHALGFAADHSLAHKEWWDVDLSDAVPR
jgi:3-hydroxyisobutyrate dehydrogenase-like beta-hydroxyacid dehydrogenase